MKDASQYPISFPYGATSAPYSAAHPHRGDDRACPVGTPVIIGGVTIGLTGATGQVTGPHLHIQESQSNYLNTRKPQNAFKPGTVVNIDPSGTQGDGSFGEFITIRNADGWDDSYCHLSQINVKVGQVIGGSMATDSLTKEEIQVIYTLAFETDNVPQDIINAYVGKPLDGLLTQLHTDPTWLAHKNAFEHPTAPNAKVLGQGLYQVN